jgi:signal transduction histidine kinase
VPGLAIAAEIAAAHGGTAEAARAFPRGLRIRLSLPGYASPRRIRTAAAPSSTSA